MKDILFVYDNTIKPDSIFKKVISNRGFADILYKRKTNISRIFEQVDSYSFFTGKHVLNDLGHEFIHKYHQTLVIHQFSYAVVIDDPAFGLLIQKLAYSMNNVLIKENEIPLLLYFSSADDYSKYLSMRKEIGIQEIMELLSIIEIENPCFLNIFDYVKFISLFSSNFDTRFFNAVKGSEYIVTKASTDMAKIKKEYTYYQLLPDTLKPWHVMPFNYREDNDSAAYDMERFYIPDMSRRWIHNAIDTKEFRQFLDRVFYYIDQRTSKIIDKQSYIARQTSLYLDKVKDRLCKFRDSDVYMQVSKYLSAGMMLGNVESLHDLYLKLYEKIIKQTDFAPYAVIGHGDLCFSNILYDNDCRILKFVDPKGAMTEEELWSDPYYDIAKLSHSICGHYDYINNGLFDIQLDDTMRLKLIIDFKNTDDFKNIFIEKLVSHGFDYATVRMFEVSLFISMLPLHAENALKVLAFILNAGDILQEIHGCLN
jgi:hypothetical protein